MEFAFTAEQEALRSDVQQFIAENVTDEIISELEDTGIRRRGPKTREMYQKIAERGWIGISWPTEYGGQDGSRIDQYIVEEEFARIASRSVEQGRARRQSWPLAPKSRSGNSSPV